MKLAGTEESLEPGCVVSKSSVQTKGIKERGGKSCKISWNQIPRLQSSLVEYYSLKEED